jgi:mono/diheme cytochrome c family protein
MGQIILSKTMILVCIVGGVMSLGSVGFPGKTWAQVDEVRNGGRELFVQHCAACHGTNAQGTGPMTSHLLGEPANLTQLSISNNGVFPFWRVYRMVDGREAIFQHGPREMPAWGNWFQIPEDEGHGPTDWRDQVRGRLWQLLVYLESIQDTEKE